MVNDFIKLVKENGIWFYKKDFYKKNPP